MSTPPPQNPVSSAPQFRLTPRLFVCFCCVWSLQLRRANCNKFDFAQGSQTLSLGEHLPTPSPKSSEVAVQSKKKSATGSLVNPVNDTKLGYEHNRCGCLRMEAFIRQLHRTSFQVIRSGYFSQSSKRRSRGAPLTTVVGTVSLRLRWCPWWDDPCKAVGTAGGGKDLSLHCHPLLARKQRNVCYCLSGGLQSGSLIKVLHLRVADKAWRVCLVGEKKKEMTGDLVWQGEQGGYLQRVRCP